jgi:hypothetical protein
MLASFRLEGEVVMNWYESKRSENAINSLLITWKEFCEMFLKCFMLESVRDARAYKFERLVQGDLTITEHELEFTWLSKYVGYMVQIEERKIKRFVLGLNSYLSKVIGAHEFKIYSVVVDHVWAIEARELKDAVSVGLAKRPKVAT